MTRCTVKKRATSANTPNHAPRTSRLRNSSLDFGKVAKTRLVTASFLAFLSFREASFARDRLLRPLEVDFGVRFAARDAVREESRDCELMSSSKNCVRLSSEFAESASISVVLSEFVSFGCCIPLLGLFDRLVDDARCPFADRLPLPRFIRHVVVRDRDA